MNIGDVVNSAIWLSGKETPIIRAQYEQDVIESIGCLCCEHGFLHGPVVFTEKHPMDNVLPVPSHISGPNVRLLIGESTVTERAVMTSEGSFVAQLEYKDLKKLRKIIRKYRPLNNRECDEIIEEIGPEAALDTLRLH